MLLPELMLYTQRVLANEKNYALLAKRKERKKKCIRFSLLTGEFLFLKSLTYGLR